MRNFLLLIISFFLFSSTAFPSNTNPDSLLEKKSALEFYIGGPNIYPAIIIQSYNNNFDLTRGMRPDYTTNRIQPIGFKFEYVLKKDFGIGLNIFYSKSSVKWDDALYHYSSEISKLRFIISTNYYIRNDEKLKYYFTGQLGYSLNKYTFDHYSDIDSIRPIHPKPEIKFNSPFSFRLGIGAKYYFKNNYGIFAEAGIGGPLVLAGISYKF